MFSHISTITARITNRNYSERTCALKGPRSKPCGLMTMPYVMCTKIYTQSLNKFVKIDLAVASSFKDHDISIICNYKYTVFT